jgi:catechol 2,3-dioxygenase-like lactoylglutathione lyase family enzyme
MINAIHALIYTKNAQSTRAFFRDVLGFPHVEAGDGWLIFGLPPAELGIHPDEGKARHELYLMCDDIHRTVAELKGKGVEFASPICDQGWGLVTSLKLPAGEEIGLYQPRHPVAYKK